LAGRLQIAVCGSSRPEDGADELAEEVGRLLAEAGATVVCGGLTGVMEAVARGAAGAGGVTVGIVPGSDVEAANEHCTHVVATGIGHARNVAVVASAAAAIAIGGQWGTLSEIGLARALGRPVVTLASWELQGAGPVRSAPGVVAATNPREAVARALELARAQPE
jgi:uncharacterized protein (TIGR00725 family)